MLTSIPACDRPVVAPEGRSPDLPVVVIGAGPIGLAAAAHLHRRQLPFLLLEQGAEIAWHVRAWAHVRLFSPWDACIDPIVRSLLDETGWDPPADPDTLPTGAELREGLLLPLSRHPALAAALRTGVRVTGVTRVGVDRARAGDRSALPFRLHAVTAEGEDVTVDARAVLDTSGSYGHPAPLGAGGLPVPGEDALGARLHPGIPADVSPFRGRRTLVVGSGHTAMGALLALVEAQPPTGPGAVLWGLRGASPHALLGGGADDALPARGALGIQVRRIMEAGRIQPLSRFRIEGFEEAPDGVRVLRAGHEALVVDRVIAATGYRPDHTLTRELRLGLDAAFEAPAGLAPLIDPADHSCGTVPRHGIAALAHPEEPGFFTLGMKSYGRAPTFLMKTGFEQVRSVVAALAGDREAAWRVEFEAEGAAGCRTEVGESACC